MYKFHYHTKLTDQPLIFVHVQYAVLRLVDVNFGEEFNESDDGLKIIEKYCKKYPMILEFLGHGEFKFTVNGFRSGEGYYNNDHIVIFNNDILEEF